MSRTLLVGESQFFFFQFEASNWLIHKAHKIFFESSMSHLQWITMLSHKNNKKKTAFVTIATKFVSIFWVCHNKWKLWRLLSKSFSARSVLGKRCSKQVRSTELIDLLPVSQRIWTPRGLGPPYQTYLLSILCIIFGN